MLRIVKTAKDGVIALGIFRSKTAKVQKEHSYLLGFLISFDIEQDPELIPAKGFYLSVRLYRLQVSTNFSIRSWWY